MSPLFKPPSSSLRSLLFSVALFACIGGLLLACSSVPQPSPSPRPQPSSTVTLSPTRSPTLAASVTPSPTRANLPIWQGFSAPQIPPVLPIPAPITELAIPDEVKVLLLAGMDQPGQLTGRTDALALVIYHPRLARASVVSIPPDFFGYIPGYTMQRMYTAYPLGGIDELETAIQYNFGVRPTSYAIVKVDTFTRLIDDLGGINVYVTYDLQHYCPGIPTGVVILNGEKALCYMRLREGDDESARNHRQQEVIQTVFLRLVENGNLARLPELYPKYQNSLETNVSGHEIFDALPLFLQLGDPGRVGFFHLTDTELNLWELSAYPKTDVFLPNRAELVAFMQQAIDFVNSPASFSDRVLTLQAQYTTSPTPTLTFTVTPTPTATETFTPTMTFTPSKTFTPTLTFTRTITRTPTSTRTPTITLTPHP